MATLPPQQPSSHLTLTTLPIELILEILPYIPYTAAHSLRALCLTCTSLHRIIVQHEKSLVRSIKTKQVFHLQLQLFPSLVIDSFKGLDTFYRRLERWEVLRGEWGRIVGGGSGGGSGGATGDDDDDDDDDDDGRRGLEVEWLQGRRWEGIYQMGGLLLYRLGDYQRQQEQEQEQQQQEQQQHHQHQHEKEKREKEKEKEKYPSSSLIDHLPATSLASIYFHIIASIKILRIYGPDPIHQRFCAGDVGVRSDVELALEEMLLMYGPEFFLALLEVRREEKKKKKKKKIDRRRDCGSDGDSRGSWAVDALHREIAGMIERQSTLTPEGTPRPPTLTSRLRRAFAAKLGLHVTQNVSKMWEIVSSTLFDEMSTEKMVQVVRGEDIGKEGLKRIF
ncbi:hypothetical protein SMMN14_04422 [Sphaerulina musiva]